ncbi:unnamed protein product [Nippostrongylus brasiliensis]|uniref:lysoplasmalogenase n=1 Tax=Nippostrongylus brasiliensis TaxID=27835 RepID=A0A0N4YU91_NIPBR|nr:hypothetical protein Q1695_012467 [Nippostrongylus brasiliensis]VDL84552.1 unnamed protein product [Nippostrongylus brasiliensis]
MQSILLAVGAIYALLVANFYNESHGFTKHYDSMYSVWKVLPIVFLTLFTFTSGGGLSKRDRLMCSLALFFGGVGDILIGLSHEGIVPGAVAFGIGHFFYMTQFYSQPMTFVWPLVIATLGWGACIGHVCVFPLLGQHPYAVAIMTVYSLVLSACLIVTGSQYLNRRPGDNEEGLRLRFIGFLLFYTSDSVLIMAHTGIKIPMSEMIILGTYYAAQYLILCGNIRTGIDTKVKTN